MSMRILRAKMSRTRTAIVILCVSALLGCGANESVLRDGNETPHQTNDTDRKTDFASDLDAMQIAGFTLIFVVRRKDGAVLNTDDIAVIKLQTADTNRRVKTDNDRAVMIGSNKEIPKENVDALSARFAVENFSGPPAVDVNVNTNSAK